MRLISAGGRRRAGSPAPQSVPRAFTLIEMVVALAIMSILMVAIGSAVALASRAIPRGDAGPTAAAAAAGKLDQLISELHFARYIAEDAPTAVTFTLPDRDGDGLPERVRYAWSGTAGDPLTRQYNGGAVAPFLANLAALNVTYETRTVREYYKPASLLSLLGPSLVHHYVTHVSISLRLKGAAAKPLYAATRMLNTPERLDAFWHTDFAGDPTRIDADGDGRPDWTTGDGNPLDPQDCAGGVLQTRTRRTLHTIPENNFKKPTTIRLRFAAGKTAGSEAAFRIHADWNAYDCTVLAATLTRQADGTQRLVVENNPGTEDAATLKTVSNLPTGFNDVRLLIDPTYGMRTVNVAVNGEDKGTFGYHLTTLATKEKDAVLVCETGAKFDRASIRVGGTSGGTL